MKNAINQTTHKVEERINELNDRLDKETEIQREKIMGGAGKNRAANSLLDIKLSNTCIIEIPKENSMKQKFLKK